MKRTHELHATVSEWKDEETGRQCKRTIQIGSLYLSKHGAQSIKLEAVPLSRDWSGWVAVKPCAQPLPPGRRVSPGMPPPPLPSPAEIMLDADASAIVAALGPCVVAIVPPDADDPPGRVVLRFQPVPGGGGPAPV